MNQHVVLVHPKATITRPPEEKFNTSNVIKADQLPSWYERFIDRDLSMVKVLSLALNVRGVDTTRAWAERSSGSIGRLICWRCPSFFALRRSVNHAKRL